uniref:Pantetheine-phosphate adenylyltransferase n=1 Tax=Crithidia acanthocephali TaxID=59798 RepID=T1YS30_9TRYP|nr:pantetheine-phosphate adenylyltransferase [Crithidia acanthocephali]
MASAPSLLLSTARCKELNAKSLVSYLIKSILVPNASRAVGDSAEAPYVCANAALACGNGGGIDVYLNIHNHHRSTFLEQSVHLYSAVLELCPQLSISIIPVMDTAAQEAAADSATATASVDSLEVFDDAAALLQQWKLIDSAAMRRSTDGFVPSYNYVAVGGTFDHFHSGHKVLLSTAALYTLGKLRVGVTDAALLTRKKFAESLQPMEWRMDYVAQFLKKVRPDLNFELTVISEMSGGTDKIGAIEALVVSPETASALPKINEMRAANGGLPPMVGIPIPQVQSPDGEIISSTVLRSHLIKGEKKKE